jgi:hypothetical protein
LHPQRIPAQSESFPERSATRGYFQVPNSLAENQALLTPAEKALILIACRMNNPDRTISDEHWTKWTGLEPRIKRAAIKGCQEKGLRVTGRGEGAKFFFDRNAWDSWVKHQPRHHRARTIGRKESVTPKAGQQIHPECRERGCQKLCDDDVSAKNRQVDVTSIDAAPNWQPVANSSPPNPPHSPPENPKTSQPQSSAKSPRPAASAPQVTSAAPLQQLIGIFLSLGVELSQLDVVRCEKLWASLSATEKTTALAYATARHADDWIDRASRFVPRPWNYLAEKHWERKAVPGTVQDRSGSKGDRATRIAGQRFKKELEEGLL